MRAIERRVRDIEARAGNGPGGFKPGGPMFVVDPLKGETEESVLAAHQAAHGPATGSPIFWHIIDRGGGNATA